MPALRLAMIAVPPLLAGLIRKGLDSRIAGATVAEFVDPQQAGVGLRESDPDVVIVGPSAPATDVMLIRTILPRAQVLTLSSDLRQIADIDSGDHGEFTLDALVARLRR